MTRNPLPLILAAVIALALASGGAYLLTRSAPAAPDPVDMEPQEIAKFMASDAFTRMDKDQQMEYLDLARRKLGGGRRMFGPPRGEEDGQNPLTDEERRQLRENVGPLAREMREQEMKKTMDAFFALPREQRKAFLDEQIDRMQERFGRWQARRAEATTRPARAERRRTEQPSSAPTPPGEPRTATRRRGPTPERMKQRIETTNPEDRARRIEYWRALRERMEERGITMRGPRIGPRR
jgi:hypothetical protein